MCLEVDSSQMTCQRARRQTFKNWPGSQDPNELSLAGFFYLQDGDEVQCHHCGIRIHQWESDEVPIAEHVRWSPDCRYAQVALKWKRTQSTVSHLLTTMETTLALLEECQKMVVKLQKLVNN